MLDARLLPGADLESLYTIYHRWLIATIRLHNVVAVQDMTLPATH